MVTGQILRNGDSTSCGCRSREVLSARATHGATGTPEYGVWLTMKARCKYPSQDSYHLYGGRGIRVCARWEEFANFISDMGLRPSDGHSIDRVDNDGHYEPGNCRWATPVEQGRNTRRSVLSEEDHRQAHCLRRLGISLAWIGQAMGVSSARIHAITKGCEYVRVRRADFRNFTKKAHISRSRSS